MSLPITICATARLARGLALQQRQNQLAKGENRWQTAEIYTLQMWLDKIIGEAFLLAIIPSLAIPTLTLSPIAEAYLWEQAIEACLEKHEAKALFDIRAMVKSAIEANNLMHNWQIAELDINSDFMTKETRQFLRWRHTFIALCDKQNAIEPARLLVMQIALIAQHQAQFTWPASIQLAGFDRITPLENSLFALLKSAGVQVSTLANLQKQSAITHYPAENANAECRAAVSWAQQKLQANPNAQLAIISPALGNVRRVLADLLDDTFHPQTIQAAYVENARCYDFSLGLTLREFPIVHSALQLLRLAVNTNISFDAITPILQDVYWGSADELDARAQLDAHLRKNLSATYGLDALLNQANLLQNRGVVLEKLLEHLEVIALFQAHNKHKQSPSAWVAAFQALLTTLNWAHLNLENQRELSSHEYQAQQKFYGCFNALGSLDAIINRITASDAVQKLAEICNNTMFQPESTGNIRIQILGLLETPAAQLDAVWAMNMNDQHWPPPVSLNPLLPVEIQRNRSTPNASAAVQSQFASLVQQRLMHCADEVVFSYALKEDERELRPSPLLAQQLAISPVALAQTLAEKLAQPAQMQLLDDHTAPPITEAESVRGGVKLFATQAVCPAWAFYQYRLGAGKLDTPVDGLDTMLSGSLLHLVLQHFWQDCKNLSTLKALDNTQRDAKIQHAIEKSIKVLSHELSYQMPPQVLKIEQKRLLSLMQMWLDIELQRADFTVQDCEKKFELDIEGLKLKLTIDRIDKLTDESLVVLDYKTSNQVTHKSWADARIAEPQLPIYAVLALMHEQVSAVAFAKIRSDDTKFIGLSAEEDLLPSVKPLHKLSQSSPFNGRFEDWQTLLAHWYTSLTNIALEIKAGEASVIFANEADLDYCDVRPLLRIPERALQFERTQIKP